MAKVGSRRFPQAMIAATVNAIAHLIAGDKNVAVYDGSLDEWMREGLPLAELNQ